MQSALLSFTPFAPSAVPHMAHVRSPNLIPSTTLFKSVTKKVPKVRALIASKPGIGHVGDPPLKVFWRGFLFAWTVGSILLFITPILRFLSTSFSPPSIYTTLDIYANRKFLTKLLLLRCEARNGSVLCSQVVHAENFIDFQKLLESLVHMQLSS